MLAKNFSISFLTYLNTYTNLKPEEEDDYSEISDKDNESNLDQSPEEQSL